MHQLTFELNYQPPLDWAAMLDFYQVRSIQGMEWVESNSYARTVLFDNTPAYFVATPNEQLGTLSVDLFTNKPAHNTLKQEAFKSEIRQLFDLDAPMPAINQHLRQVLSSPKNYQSGLRIPGIWNLFEAGIRAILGQQITVKSAISLVTQFVQNLGQPILLGELGQRYLFPKTDIVANSSLDFFKMPQSRKDTVRRLADYFETVNASQQPMNVDDWLSIKGIGPWTVNYVKMRACRDKDIWLAGDAGLKNALKKIDTLPNVEHARPWRSYLTFQIWHQLN